MILRCTTERKHARWTGDKCAAVVGAYPDGHGVIGTVEQIADAHPDHHVLRCGNCGTMYEVAKTLDRAA